MAEKKGFTAEERAAMRARAKELTKTDETKIRSLVKKAVKGAR